MDGGLLIGFQDVAFLPPVLAFLQPFFKIVVEVKAKGPPHILKLVGVSKGIQSAK